MTAPRRVQHLAYAALGAIVIAISCAKAEDSPLADRGGDNEGGDNGGGKGGTAAQGGSAGSTSTGGKAGTATGGTAGKGGTTSTGGKGGTTTGGSTSKGGTGGGAMTTYGCLAGEGGAGGAGGASGGAPGEGGAGPITLFTDDFEDGDATGWSPTEGSWSVVTDGSDVYEQSNFDENVQYLSAVTDTCWADQIVEARVKVVDFDGNSTTNAVGLFGRYVSAQTHYMIGMDSGNNGEVFIGRRIQSTENAPDRFATKTNMRWVEGTWYTLRLEVIGSSLKAYVDDVLQVEATDTQITSGGVAVGARHAHVRFDDVRVTQ